MMMSKAMISVIAPVMANWKANSSNKPNKPKNTANVTGISSGKINIITPATIGTADSEVGILKMMNKIPSATRYPPAIRYRKLG
jgi:hypothetical protein